MFDGIIAQDCCCATSLMPFTIENGPQRFSADRIDDSKGHTVDNVKYVCRIFNPGNGKKMSHKLFLYIFLKNRIVPIPDDVREIARARMLALPREEWWECDLKEPL